jgi:hypothetical protein
LYTSRRADYLKHLDLLLLNEEALSQIEGVAARRLDLAHVAPLAQGLTPQRLLVSMSQIGLAQAPQQLVEELALEVQALAQVVSRPQGDRWATAALSSPRLSK